MHKAVRRGAVERRVAIALAFSFFIFGAHAQEADFGDLSYLNLEDLMKVEVTSASRKQQKMADVAAAVYVISQEDIRRSGATNIPEALRLAPGLNVARIGSSSWAISARGFNGRYANKLLVLMDGRSIYTPLFSGVFWDLQDTFMEDIERIEVIRGPGAAMWGANAVNGVINIITKSSRDTQGNLLVAGVGNEERAFSGFRHGGQTDEDTHYRVYAKTFDRQALEDQSGKRQDDDWRGFRSGFRVDKKLTGGDRLTTQGDAYSLKVGETVRSATTLTPPYSNAYAVDDTANGLNLLARWQHRLADQSELTLQAYFDRAEFIAPKLSETQNTLDLDLQHRLSPSLIHDIMWGANIRYIQSRTVGSPDINFDPGSHSYSNFSLFVQDDLALIPERLRLTLGSKFEKPHFGGTQLQPNARLLWTPDGANSVWISASRASRTPSRGENESRIALDVIPPLTATNPYAVPMQLMTAPGANLQSEKLTAYEIGYRTLLTSQLSLDIAAFSNHYRNLMQWAIGSPALTMTPTPYLNVPLTYINANTALSTRGIELVADWRLLDWMRLEGSYTYLHVDVPALNNGTLNTSTTSLDKQNQYSLRWKMDLTEKTQLDIWLRHVGKQELLAVAIPAYTTLDFRLGYTVTKGFDISLVGQNLLDRRHAEFAESSSIPVYYLPRAVYAKATWKF